MNNYTQPTYIPKTAINELDAFMAGLTEEDRAAIFDTPQFSGLYNIFTNRFMFYLLQSDLGTEYISSSPQRREIAESLKLMAHSIYAEKKKSTMTEIEKLKKEIEELKKGNVDAK